MSSTDQSINQPLLQGTNISHTENPPESRTKLLSYTDNLLANFKNSHSSLNIQLIDNIPKTLRSKNPTQIEERIKEFSCQKINIQYSYTLPKGGLAIYTETETYPETLDKGMNNIFPGSSCTVLLTQTGFTKLVIKNINLLSQPKILSSLWTGNSIKVQRLEDFIDLQIESQIQHHHILPF